jgi:hypothetical protein
MPLIRALSIDIGWKHLAYAMLEVGSENETKHTSDEDFSIKAWNCESLLTSSENGPVNVNDTSLDELIRLTVPSIAKILDFWIKWPGSSEDLKVHGTIGHVLRQQKVRGGGNSSIVKLY